MTALDLDKFKRAAALVAVDYVKDGMVVGLGTGSTAKHLVLALEEKVKAGLQIRAVSTSQETAALAARCGLSVANASQHLRLMRGAGLLTSRRDGKRILYAFSDPAVLDAVAALHKVAERSSAQVRAVIGSYFQARDALEPVSRKELLGRLKADLITVLDVRPADEYSAGHLPKAVNIPLRELQRRLREIPKDREIVMLYAWEDLPRETIAQMMGMTRSALDQRIHRANQRLARMLEPQAEPIPSPPIAQEGGGS